MMMIMMMMMMMMIIIIIIIIIIIKKTKYRQLCFELLHFLHFFTGMCVFLSCNALSTQRSCFAIQGDIPSVRKIQHFKTNRESETARQTIHHILRGTKKGAGMCKQRLRVEFW